MLFIVMNKKKIALVSLKNPVGCNFIFVIVSFMSVIIIGL